MRLTPFLFLISISNIFAQSEDIVRNQIGITSYSKDSSFQISLYKRFQSFEANTTDSSDFYDTSIASPKSVTILDKKNKFYIQSLEGFTTSVYDLTTFERLSIIKHSFGQNDQYLFQDTTVFDYQFRYRKDRFNIFKGKPVESTLSHDGKYLWVTYYRRDYDKNAVSPSAVAIIDTDADSIVRVMPTGPLPKMIATSPDNKYVAVTHWGDNTVGLIDISADSVSKFKYVKHLVVERKLRLNYSGEEKVDRDNDCGFCLRGTVFTSDSQHLLIGRMGGGGIAFFEMDSLSYLGSAFGMELNIRHLVIKDSMLYISTNRTGYVQKTNVNSLIFEKKNQIGEDIIFKNWESKYIGAGVRTISVSQDQKYIFAAVNNESKISILAADQMEIVAEIPADSFPVGMDISSDDTNLIVTSQGKYKKGGGNSVMVYKIIK